MHPPGLQTSGITHPQPTILQSVSTFQNRLCHQDKILLMNNDNLPVFHINLPARQENECDSLLLLFSNKNFSSRTIAGHRLMLIISTLAPLYKIVLADGFIRFEFYYLNSFLNSS